MMERLPQRFCPPSELGNPQRTRVSTFPQRRRLRLSNWTQLLNPRKSNVSTDSRPEPLVLGFDVQFAGYLVFARHFGGLGLASLLLVLGPYRPLKRDLAVLRDGRHIVGIGGQGFVLHYGLANLLCDIAVG